MELLAKRDLKKLIKPFGIKPKGTFLKKKNKVFLVSDSINQFKEEDFKTITAGLYIGKIEPFGFRLTIEGTQLLRPEENVLQVDNLDWLEGKDVITNKKFQGCVAIKYKDDFLGSGLYSQGKIKNFVPKIRRITPQ